MTTRIGRWLAVAAGAAMVAVLGSCGGDSGGDGVTPPPPTNVTTTGAITGFGSVYVNGVRYATGGADIEIDGTKATQADLKVGQVVDIKGTMDDGSAKADVIRYHHNLEGPVTAIEGLSFVAMGQTVLVSSDTSLGDPITIDPDLLVIKGLVIGDVVEVSGLIDADGSILATRVDLRLNEGAYDVYGTASEVDAALKTFRINALRVDYSSANIEDFPSGAPSNGDLVLVTGLEFDDGGEFIATKVELRYDQEVLPDPGDMVNLQGVINAFVSATAFEVAGFPVTTTTATVYENGTVADLALDVQVCVVGTLDANGVLVATRIRFHVESSVRIVSDVSAIDLGNDRLTVLGLQVTTDNNTRFEDESAADVEPFSLAGLHTGDWVDVRGYEYPADSGKVYATRVERVDDLAAGEHRVRGPFRDPATPDFDVLAVAVHTIIGNADPSLDTRFRIETVPGEPAIKLEPAEFFALPEETLVEARGTWSGTVLTAEYAIVKTCDD
ncbi:MAG: hypothetical protein H6R27_1261 [Proteobacteria bacterium]|nr:hypothetical protein [Pseudomonadota bacterium]